MSAAHTPGPWRVVRANPSPTTGEFMIAGAKPGYLAEVRDCGTGDVAANARRIVQCVNSHDALIDLLRKARAQLPLAAASWNEEPQYQCHVNAVLALIAEIDAAAAKEPS